MAQLNGEVAWITGAGRGIGAAIAKELALAGCRVALAARNAQELERTRDEIHRLCSTSVLTAVCDVSQSASVEKTVAEIKGEWGPVQILVNNAGLAVFRKIIDTPEADWDAMMQTNVKSAFLCTRAVLPDMIDAKSGHILNIVSIAGRQPYYNCGGYCASKYALQGFTDVLRMEVRKHGIRVTSVMPGATDTAIWGDANVDHSRMMTPEQIGRAVASICCLPPPAMVEELVLRPQGGDL